MGFSGSASASSASLTSSVWTAVFSALGASALAFSAAAGSAFLVSFASALDSFTGSAGAELLRQYAPALGTVGRVYRPGEIREIFEMLIADGLRNTGFAAPLCASLLRYLVVRIADSQLPGHAGPTPAYATYQRCRQHIQSHCVQLKSLQQIARECRVDKAYLCRLFQRFDHQTPYQFLQRMKMNRAAERLRNPNMLVKQVAAELGFDDPFHFSRTFKHVFGLAPDAFRRLR